MKVNLKKYLVWLTVAFVLVTIYTEPGPASESIGAFLGTLGSLFVDLLDASAEFAQGLVD